VSWRFRKHTRHQEPGEPWRWAEPEPPDDLKKDLFFISLFFGVTTKGTGQLLIEPSIPLLRLATSNRYAQWSWLDRSGLILKGRLALWSIG
jgi:hypothetical protein